MRRSLLAAALLLVLAPGAVGSATVGDLRPFVRGSWQDIRRAHAGRPVVVHFWGLTCGPCRVEMPRWGRLLQQRPDFELVLVNADLVPDEPGATTAMLQKTGLATAENWIFDDAFVERLRYEINPQWQGELPFTLLIARDGTATVIEGVADLGAIAAWLDDQARPAK